MLRVRDWQPRTFHTKPCSSFYAFLLNPLTLTMTPVAASSLDFDVLASTDENSDWVCPEQQVARVLVEVFKEIPQVQSICAQFGDNEIVVWTLLESYDREARERVYEKELQVCTLLRINNFDFRVTSVELVQPEELVGAGSREIYKRN